MDPPGPAAQKAAGKKKFPCPKQGCDKVFEEKKYVDRHVRDVHTVKSHICQEVEVERDEHRSLRTWESAECDEESSSIATQQAENWQRSLT